MAEETRSDKAKWADIRNPLRFQGQYWDVETGLHYNRYRYYDPQVGRFISKDPIGLNGGPNLYTYAFNPIQWLDPLGLARTRNPIEGDRRHRTVNEKLTSAHPNATIQCECYLRDSAGNSVYDTDVTNTRRRIDTVVIEDGKAHTYEITSLTADKRSQSQKERRIIENGGTYIRDRKTKNLVPITGPSIIIREP
ncbi:RHS repeat-associated core domain-containing protein [Pseudomonas putida]|uniref:RHS repeat-associated core domain-containing protein n=1 Tax=Pseudomonas putida TaxID=303 RepID=UPI001F4E93C1|nr:RHS repeat-associated core domain-containing protein [Pseudomonas putida]